jgi:hypothetical protein
MDRSLECRANIDFVLACLPWDLGCADFVVFNSGLCAITAAPPAGASAIFQTQLRLAGVHHRASLPYSMSYHTRFLWILIFILFYSEQVLFLAGYVPPENPRLALEARSGSGCHGGKSRGHAGEY